MDPSEFEALYQGTWAETDRSRDLWVCYEFLCESYDLLVCSARNRHGVAIPVTPEEHKLINRNAHRARRLMEIVAGSLGVVIENRPNLGRVPFSTLEEMAKHTKLLPLFEKAAQTMYKADETKQKPALADVVRDDRRNR